jgi:hypothetical protein
MAAAAGSGNTLIIHPWNPINKLITKDDIMKIFDTMGIASKITIQDLSRYQKAFVHSSYVEATANQALSNHKTVLFSSCPSDCLPF